jgi:NAD+ kinase
VSERSFTVMTHRRPAEVTEALAKLRSAAAKAGVTLRFDAEEVAKHHLEPSDGVVLDADVSSEVDLCLVLGGDGTILAALRRYGGTSVPVFAINYGDVGFLATVDPDGLDDGLDDGLRRALSGDFEAMSLPALSISSGERSWHAVNDVSFHRKTGNRVAYLSYAIGEDEVGRVRCDGLVVATPAGSTGYNLANGGPVMAWGVEGFVVSFIAPHSLTARTLVVAPGDTLTVRNCSPDDATDVTVDGRPTCELGAGEALEARFADGYAQLAQVPGANFYHRLRERFGRLAS